MLLWELEAHSSLLTRFLWVLWANIAGTTLFNAQGPCNTLEVSVAKGTAAVAAGSWERRGDATAALHRVVL